MDKRGTEPISCRLSIRRCQIDRWYQDGRTKTGGLLPDMLGESLGTFVRDADLMRPLYRKPAFDVHRRPELAGVDFSIAATNAWVALVVVRGGTVGIDIEVDRDFDLTRELLAMVQHPLDPDPVLDESFARRASFLNTWTRKEAVLKARGVGLSCRPANVRLLGDEACMPDGTRWHVQSLSIGQGLYGAIAASRPVVLQGLKREPSECPA